MREIKFRKWDFEEGEMIPGDALAFEEYAPLTDLLTQKGIMQYTGLKDVNGNDIYEGDIIDYKETCIGGADDIIGVVEYSEGSFWVVDESNEVSNFLFSETAELEIIGNVYEDPEFLEAGIMVDRYVTSEYKRWNLINPVNQRIVEPKNSLTDKIESAVTSHVEFLESEYKKAFEHFNVPINEVPNRAKIVRKVDRSEELHIDDIPVFVAYEPKVASDNLFEHSVVFEYKRLYEEAGE
ncbi:YopX family protein [Bacillus subtilis]|uniref:YopX family protein n=1 Tax=Bacillus subtilis TaxID=1423 RepID=UPI001BAE1F36|nr:YopX family protein [Bacillus subtilis]QUG79104.1 hypothetical protein GSN02_06380 [Bacillus subtilis]